MLKLDGDESPNRQSLKGPRNDALARQSLSTFVMQRDDLTASYGAALAAGGEDIDWRSWFEERINAWDNEAGAAAAHITLSQGSHAYMQRRGREPGTDELKVSQ